MLEANPEVYKLLCDSAPHCEYLEDAEGLVVYASPSCEKLLGEGCTVRNLEQLLSEYDLTAYKTYRSLLLASDQTLWRAFRLHPLEGGVAEALLCGRRVIAPDDSVWLRMSLTFVVDDVHEQLSRLLGMVDPLTGLARKEYVLHRLLDLKERLQANPDLGFAGVYVDIDRLKKINDAYGPSMGDQIIKEAARRLRENVPDHALVARLGGDEFFVVLENVTTRVTIRIVKTLLAVFAQPFALADQEVSLSAGFGVVVSPVILDKPEDIIRYANIAVRTAKLSRHRFKVFNQAMLERSIKRMELEIDLYRGLKQGEFFVRYQPIFSLETQRMTGVEALLRWQHPKWGEVQPSEFIPIAEETGFIIPLGIWVLKKACEDMREMLNSSEQLREMSVSVNLSQHQLALHDIVDQVLRVLDETGLDPKHLKLEITETVAMANPEITAEKIRHLMNLGVRMSIDDFGTGYSSLSHLQSLPIDTIKVDKSFVSRMNSNPKKRKLVRSVINLAQNLRLKVVAEGIEMNEQWSMLKALDCEGGQGFLFAKPLSKEAILDIIATGGRMPE